MMPAAPQGLSSRVWLILDEEGPCGEICWVRQEGCLATAPVQDHCVQQRPTGLTSSSEHLPQATLLPKLCALSLPAGWEAARGGGM